MSDHGIPKLMKSKRFWSMLIGLIVSIGAALHPDLQDNLQQLQPMILGIVGIAIGGYSVQDVARELGKNGGANSEVPAQD